MKKRPPKEQDSTEYGVKERWKPLGVLGVAVAIAIISNEEIIPFCQEYVQQFRT